MFKTTKSRLLLSALSLLVCISMFVGSTFAWFTDSVSSVNNIIKSGNLDIEVEYSLDGSTYTALGEASIFPVDDLWEPGFTRVVALRVKNVGSLAAKLDVATNVASEITGTNVYGETFKLSDYLEVYSATDIAAVDFSNRASVAGMTKSAFGKSLFTAGELLPEAEQVVVLAITMPTTVGNEANHKTGTTAPQITFGITVNATQQMYESDSFGNDYDDITTVSDVASLKSAIEAGENVMLNADVALDADATITVADGSSVLLDLNGHEISGVSSTAGTNRKIFTVKGEMNVTGNGTVSMEHTGTNMEWNNLTAPFSVEGGVLTLGDGVTVINNGGSDMAYAVDVNTTLGESVLNVNGAVLVSTYTGVRIFNNHKTEKGIVNYNDGIIQGESRDIWAQIMANPAENAVVNIAEGIDYTVEEGSKYYIDADDAVSSAAELKNALAAGGEVVLASNISLKDAPIAIADDTTIDLNGKTLSGVSTSSTTSNLIKVNKDSTLTLTNGTVKFEATNPDTDWGTEGFPTYANNTISCSGELVIDGATIINNTPAGGASYAIDCYPGADLTVNSGTITSANNVAIRMFANSNTVSTDVTINGGTISGMRSVWIQLPSSKVANVRQANLTITGGTFNVNDAAAQPAIYSYSYGDSFAGTNVTISGGTFNGDVQFGGGAKDTVENVTITGGTFNGALGRWIAGDEWQEIAKP